MRELRSKYGPDSSGGPQKRHRKRPQTAAQNMISRPSQLDDNCNDFSRVCDTKRLKRGAVYSYRRYLIGYESLLLSREIFNMTTDMRLQGEELAGCRTKSPFNSGDVTALLGLLSHDAGFVAGFGG